MQFAVTHGLTQRIALKTLRLAGRAALTIAPPVFDKTPSIALHEQELASARATCNAIRTIIDDRLQYIGKNGLDQAFCLPDGIWTERGNLYRGTAALLSEKRDIINNLRHYTQQFTGYSLVEMRRAEGLPIPDGTSPIHLAEPPLRSRRYDEWVLRYWILAKFLPGELRLSQPKRFGERGWLLHHRLVNHDAYVYLERIALMHRAQILRELHAASQVRNALILEIGGGYGGLAYHLKRLIPKSRYILIDIPESLLFSAIYLTTLFPDQHHVVATNPDLISKNLDLPGFTFVPNHFTHVLPEIGFSADLALNTLSMSEMSQLQVRTYCAVIHACLRPGAPFFEQNQDNRHLGLMNAEEFIAETFTNRRQLAIPNGATCGHPNVWRS